MQFVTTLGGNIGELNKKYPTSADPFYDPLQDVLIGTAVAYLNPMSYIVSVDRPLTILDQRGSAEGELLVNIKPEVFRDELMENQVDTDEENEPKLEHYMNATLRIHLSIQGARHLDISKCDGVYVEFQFLNEESETRTLSSKEVGTENVTLSYTNVYEYDITSELLELIGEDVVEFHVKCKGTEKNAVSSAPRLGFLSDDGDGTTAARSFQSPTAGEKRRGGGGGERKMGGGGLGGGIDELDTMDNYGGAVDAHKSELEKAAMRQRIAELEDQLNHAQSKSKACVLL